MDIQAENRIFIRIFFFSAALSLLLAAGYLLFGDQIIRYFYEGGSLNGLIRPRQSDERTFEQYAHDSSVRFWTNGVAGIPLSLIVLFLLYKLYRYLFRQAAGPSGVPVDDRVKGARLGVWTAAGIYGILTAAYFYPSFDTFASNMIGPSEDNMACYWTLSWAYDHVFRGGGSLTYVNDILYPEGSSFYYHAWSFYNLYLSFGLRQFFGAVTTYNLLILHSFVFAGLGAYLLAKYLLRNHWLAVLAGFLFAFNPAHVARATHHMNIATVQFIPLFVLFYIKAARGESRRAVLLATVFLLCNALVDWNYLLYGFWFMLFAYIYLAIRRKRWWLSDIAGKSAIMAGGTVVALLPWLWPMIRSALSDQVFGAGGHNQFVVDLSALFVPFPLHLLGGLDVIKWINSSHTAWYWETTAYLGVAALLVVAIQFKQIVRETARFLLGGISFLLMSLGAQPHFLGQFVPALVPGRIVPLLPILSNSRAPSRNIVFVYLFWSLIVSLAVGRIWNRLEWSRLRNLAVIGVVALLALDYFAVSRETTPVDLPPCYAAIPADGPRFGILDLPGGYEKAGRYMMYQSLHGLPIVQGWVSRRISLSLLDRLNLKDLSVQKAQLVEAKVKYVVLHKMYLPSDDCNPEEYRSTYEPVYEDGGNLILRVY